MKTVNFFQENTQNIQPIVTMGVFDGIHLGHQKLLQKVVNYSKKYACDPAVVTFREHPSKITRGLCPPSILSLEKRLRIFEFFQISHCILIDFDENVAKLSPQEFVEKYLVDKWKIKGIIIGENFRFGSKGAGTPSLLKEISKKHNFFVEIESHETIDETVVSSSEIRKAVQNGDCIRARKMLLRPFSLNGIVISGQKRGRTLGFPTANLKLEHSLVPNDGVYTGATQYDNILYPTLISIGTNPTFNEKQISVEAYLEGFNQQIYGEYLEIHLLSKIRDQIKFTNIENLIEKMNSDKQILLEKFENQISCNSSWEAELGFKTVCSDAP